MKDWFGQTARDRLVDLAIVGVVLWFTLAQFGSQGFGDLEDVATDPDGLGFALVLLSGLPLLVRRRFPRSVLLVTLAASIALAALGYAVHGHAGVAAALYTVASGPGRSRVRGVWALALAAFATLVALEVEILGFEPQLYVVDGILWIGAWLVGDRRRLARQRAADAEEQRDREQRLVVAEERTRIARELHDSAGHAINTILVQAGAARVLRERDPEGSRAAIEAIEEVARETIEDIDRIVGSLREESAAERTPLPGVEQIPGLVDRQRASGLDVDLQMDGTPARSLPAAVDRAAYRIAQETLTNAARHGTGTAAMVIERGAGALELTVSNPVKPGPTGRPGGGRGIAGMRERVSLLGGSLEVGRDGADFRVHAKLPI